MFCCTSARQPMWYPGKGVCGGPASCPSRIREVNHPNFRLISASAVAISSDAD